MKSDCIFFLNSFIYSWLYIQNEQFGACNTRLPFSHAFERYSVSFGLVTFLFVFFVKNEKLGLTNQLNLNLNGVEVYG